MGRVSVYLLGVVCLSSTAPRADYLELRRSALIYAEASRTSDVLSKMQVGTQLPLLEGDTQSGYYHVELGSSGQTGWIYRSMVRRHPGSVPGPSNGGASPGGAGGGGFPAAKCPVPYNEEPGSLTAFDQSCGLTGTAASGSGEFPQNIAKND